MRGRLEDTDLRYLESSAALSARIKVMSGHAPNSMQTAFASSCLLQGRLFWDSADAAPLETKPLLLYYGFAAFAKALVLVMKGCLPQDLAQAHGLSCSLGDGDRIGNFTMKANGHGLFQDFNDVAASLNKLSYYEGSSLQTRLLPTASSDQLSNLKVRLSDCFSRIPDLGHIYKMSTGIEPQVLPFYFSDDESSESGDFRSCSIRVDVSQLFNDHHEFCGVVGEVRRKAPFLEQWRLQSASRHWDKTVLTFENRKIPQNELGQMLGGPDRYESNPALSTDSFEATSSMPPTVGSTAFTGSTGYIEPIDGKFVSEHGIRFAALLGLSSLVRYQPHVWTACIYRRQLSNRPVDDVLLPVIEEFLAMMQYTFPRFVADAILGR